MPWRAAVLLILPLSLSFPCRAQDAEVVRLIERLTKDESARQRRLAARALGELGSRAKAAIPALVQALDDPDSTVRDEAEAALSRFGEAVVPELVEKLKDPDQFVRLRVVSVLGRIGPEAKAALPAVEEAKADPSPFVRAEAEKAALRIGLDAKTLLNLLKGKDEEKRLYAIRAAGYLGHHAKPVLPELCQLLRWDKERNKEIRREAAKSLAELGKDARDALPAMTNGLADPDDGVKLHLLAALEQLGPEARSAIPAVDRVIKLAQRNRNQGLYDAAVRTLNQVKSRGPDGR
jgi:HEAT repeat protein